MTGPATSAAFGPPARITAIESRIGTRVGHAPRQPLGAALFESILSAEAERTAASKAGSLPSPTPTTLDGPASLALATTSPPLATLIDAGSPDQGDGRDAARGPAGEAVIDAARRHLGVPYLWGGTDPVRGFDCSGLVQDAYAAIGVEMPKWSRHQATMGVEVDGIEAALPGDVLAFGHPVNHVALYVGDGLMLHAPRRGDVVKIDEIDRPIASIRRIVAAPGQEVPVTEPWTGDVEHRPSTTEASYRELFESAGRQWDIDPALLAAVAQTESGFDPTAVSPVGAQGLMQFMPATAREMGVDPWDPASAIDGAARYLRRSLDRFGAIDLAVASYNAGPGAVDRYGGIPPYPETEDYVDKVLRAWRSRA